MQLALGELGVNQLAQVVGNIEAAFEDDGAARAVEVGETIFERDGLSKSERKQVADQLRRNGFVPASVAEKLQPGLSKKAKIAIGVGAAAAGIGLIYFVTR